LAGVSADAARVLAAFSPESTIYVQGGVGEPLALRGILEQDPEVLSGVTLTGCPIPGMNEFDYAGLHPGARFVTFMLPGAWRSSFQAGPIIVRPASYSQIAAAFMNDPPVDLAILQVTPPDAEGMCSFGPCSDFAPLIWRRARRRLAFVNAGLPRAARGPTIPLSAIDEAIEIDGPYITAEDGAVGAEQAAIARRLVDLIQDGAAIQTGIGGAPTAALMGLGDRRGLVIRSGMVTPAYQALAEAGALAAGGHITGLALGPDPFVRWATATIAFADATVTHGAASLLGAERLHAINSALEVDLFGQANVEWRGGRLSSGLGGAPDFARAARRSPGGRAILALPATAAKGTVSRIVARLDVPTVSIPRDDTDLVVTEHGVADLRGATLDGRAEALIAIAAPEHRERLATQWEAMRRGL
jgi:acyl-CoA hydrolase